MPKRRTKLVRRGDCDLSYLVHTFCDHIRMIYKKYPKGFGGRGIYEILPRTELAANMIFDLGVMSDVCRLAKKLTSHGLVVEALFIVSGIYFMVKDTTMLSRKNREYFSIFLSLMLDDVAKETRLFRLWMNRSINLSMTSSNDDVWHFMDSYKQVWRGLATTYTILDDMVTDNEAAMKYIARMIEQKKATVQE